MRRIPPLGKNIIIKYLLDMNQRTLARAIAPVLEGRKHNGVGSFVHGSGAIILFVALEFREGIMSAILKEIANQALSLTPKERGELIHRLIVSLEGEAEDSPEAIAKAWDEEIARRVADMEAGKTVWIPAEEVFARLDAIIDSAR